MQIGNSRWPSTVSAVLVSVFLSALFSFAAGGAELRGTVSDPLGAVVPLAEVTLLRNNIALAQTTTNDLGEFVFSAVSAGRYRVRATAPGFTEQESSDVYLGGDKSSHIVLPLKIGTVTQQVVVSATGTPAPDSQVGASVAVIRDVTLTEKLDVLEPLRLVPGIQVLQTGPRGGTTDLFVRGGNADANKVLLDGIPVNDIGGRVEFGNLSAAGIDQVEVLRGPNSVLYGADALASVVSLSTRQGNTHLPELSYSIDGGNFGTKRQEVSIGGAHGPLDYFSDFSRFDTENGEPNSAFHNGTYAGNFGWSPNSSTQVRFTLRRTVTALGLPNALDLYGIADDSFQKEQDTYYGVTAQNQTTERWHNLVRYGATRLRFQFDNPSPTGDPFDPFGSGANFLGNQVTLRGANGFVMSGRGILDFAGVYPSLFDSQSNRNFIYTQSEYMLNRHLSGLLAFRYEKENGFTRFAGAKTPTDRNNFSYIAQLAGNLWDRLYATAGVGIEGNAIFGVEASPRVSLAYYLARLQSTGFLNGTKLRFNYGRGIKEPAIFDESTSLFALLSQLPNGPQLMSQFHVRPIGAERSRSFDFGADEIAWNGRAKLGLTLFHNEFADQIEFVDASALPQLGVPLAVAAATPFGASINSGAYRAMGAEAELELNLGHGITAKGSYTYLDAVVQRSFASSALAPAFNPNFPTIAIGTSTPLVGGRPFRRASHSGDFLIGYIRPKFTLSFGGSLVGRRDDSTHLTDAFFGNTLLLPNRNLDAAYQKIDLNSSLRINSAIELYTSLENILNEHYDAAFGFPSLPFTFRTGMKFTLGGESWKIH
jgi:iron complex outermembrane receptor protein/vitamin B12 transporter